MPHRTELKTDSCPNCGQGIRLPVVGQGCLPWACRQCRNALGPTQVQGTGQEDGWFSRREKLENYVEKKSQWWAQELSGLVPVKFRCARLSQIPVEIRRAMTDISEGQGLYLHGLPGRGKTYAMSALLRHYIDKSVDREKHEKAWGRVIGSRHRINSSSIYCRVRWDDLLIELRGTMNTKSQMTEQDIQKKYRSYWRLFIEDLGTTSSRSGQETDFAIRTLLGLLDSRMEAGRPTYFTSNLNPKEVGETFDNRIESRIYDCCRIIFFGGPDRRRP